MSINNSQQISDIKTMLVKGMNGEGIESIEKTATEGFIDTYTITYTDGTKTTFDVTNGNWGIWTPAVTAAASATSVTINNDAIGTTSILEVYSQNVSGTVITVNDIDVTPGTAVLTFPALAEATDFILHIVNGTASGGGGGGGTTDYLDLTNKPQINGVTLTGNKAASQLGLMASDGVVANPTGQTTGTLTALEVGGTKYAVLDETAVGHLKGVDLTVKFADEIANYTDAWAWFQARLNADNLEGIHVKDYIPFSVSGENHKARIAGIDTFYNTGSTGVGHHVDFISEDCYGTTHRYNATNTNQGNATTGSPFKASELYGWLNSTVYNALPAELKAVIKEKYLYYPLRYTSGSNLTDDNNWEFGSFGKLWLPLEGEIFDTPQWSTKGYGNPYATQYPIFANDASARMKGVGPGGSRATWCTASAYSGNATSCVLVGGHGNDDKNLASYAYSVPICFRLIKAA